MIESNHRRLFRLNLATGKSEELPILPPLAKKNLIFRGCLGETIALSDGDFAWVFNAQTREWKRMGKCNGAVYGIRGTTCYAVTQ